ncbi:MAG: helix-turn-helix transcriptional regulator [Archaeoglobaceae archaeon]
MRLATLILLLLATPAVADTIYGKVYSWETLEPIDAVVIIKNGVEQRMVAINGSYSFKVEPGNYTIIAKSGNLIAIENVSVRGDVHFDLILFPEFELPEEVPEMPIEETEDYSFIALLLSFAGIVAIYAWKKKHLKPKEELLPEDLKAVIEVIKANGGRITQKELRKRLGFSEAKMSLIIADLERRGVIEKVKKGRGNVIFLKTP